MLNCKPFPPRRRNQSLGPKTARNSRRAELTEQQEGADLIRKGRGGRRIGRIEPKRNRRSFGRSESTQASGGDSAAVAHWTRGSWGTAELLFLSPGRSRQIFASAFSSGSRSLTTTACQPLTRFGFLWRAGNRMNKWADAGSVLATGSHWKWPITCSIPNFF
jgi:hypothetical protein